MQEFNGLMARYGKNPEDNKDELLRVLNLLSVKLDEIIDDQN